MSSSFVLVGDKVHAYERSASGIGAFVLADTQPLGVYKDVPAARWCKGKIPISLWQQVLSFFKFTYDTYKGEAQVRLLYNQETGQWAAHAFPQEKPSGMTTRELWDHPNRAVDYKAFTDAGFEDMGTVHHHCSASAFQSHTDTTDEKNRVGLHLTVGHMDKQKHDLHARIVFHRPGIVEGEGENEKVKRAAAFMQFGAYLPDWFALPDALAEHLPEEMAEQVLTCLLTKASAVPFPDRWKENLIERVFPGGGVVQNWPIVPRGNPSVNNAVAAHAAVNAAGAAYNNQTPPTAATVAEYPNTWKEWWGNC